MENLYKEYAKNICPNCTNKDCENGKGIHVFTINGSKSARCTDYKSDIKIIKPYFLPYGRNKKC